MPQDIDFESLYSLTWFRVHFTIQNTRYHKDYVQEHIVSVVNSIVKAISIQASVENVVFKMDPQLYKNKGTKSELVPITVMLSTEANKAETWFNLLLNYFNQPTKKINFALNNKPTIEVRNLEMVINEYPNLETTPEWCLDYQMPLPLLTDKNSLYTLQSFIDSNLNRINRIFNTNLNSKNYKLPNSLFLSHLQNYTKEITHLSKSSNKKQEQWLQGFVGPIYISGEKQNLLPLIALCAEWNSGSELSNSMGFFTLHTNPKPFFDAKLTNSELLQKTILLQTEESDYFDAYVAGFENKQQCSYHLLAHYTNIILSGNYIPQPAHTFFIAKTDESKRRIDQLNPEDEMLQHFVFEQIQPQFDQLQKQSCIGFRKGYSRLKAAQLLENAIAQGFTHLIHTDIEDYFPSIQHNKLIQCIQQSIPLADPLTLQLLTASIAIPSIENGKIIPRTIGLAQGSSLSPLLANLYLDAFDEFISTLPIQLIRFVDDVLLLCKSKEEAEQIAHTADHFLSDWGLHLKTSKTFICKTTDTFQFLGLQFVNGKMESEEKNYPLFKKKPLYITENYTYLSFHKNAIQVRKNKELQNTIPLNQVSEIMAHYQSTISGVLINQCLKLGIPITLSLSSAYHLTTIKPNTKTYHETMTIHGLAFYHTSEADKLAIAQSIATAKFENIIPLFEQRYEANTSDIVAFFKKGIEAIESAQSVDQVRGHEGYLTREFYNYFNALLQQEEFILKKRDYQSADPMNALLNYSSFLLMTKINSIVRALGLNPYLGFLHSSGSNYESLVYDIMEAFRGRLYRFIIKIVNLKIVKATDFEITKYGAYLNPEARKAFIAHFEKELNTIDKQTHLTLREHIYAQVIIIKNWAYEEGSLTFYKWHV